MKLTKQQKEVWKVLMFEDDQWPKDERTATEIIEEQLAEDVQAHRASDLFDKLVAKGDIKHAQHVAHILWKRHGIEVGDDKTYKQK